VTGGSTPRGRSSTIVVVRTGGTSARQLRPDAGRSGPVVHRRQLTGRSLSLGEATGTLRR